MSIEAKELYIYVSGGCVQGVRVAGIPLDDDTKIVVFDMDDVRTEMCSDENKTKYAEERIYGETWANIEKRTKGVY